MRTKTEIKFKKNFPFTFLKKRPMTEVECIQEDVWSAVGLFYAAMPIIISIRIYLFVKKIFHK